MLRYAFRLATPMGRRCGTIFPFGALVCGGAAVVGDIYEPWVEGPVPVAAGPWGLAAFTARRQEEKVDG